MLTVTAIQKPQATDKQYRMADERELVLLVCPNGAKLWQLRYRHEGKEKPASLGQYPDVGLSVAREKRDELRKQIAAGTDPIAAKRAKVAKADANKVNTFEAVARDWWAHWKVSRSGSSSASSVTPRCAIAG